MANRAFRVVVELDYTANTYSSNDVLAEEIKRCRQSFQKLLKERGANNVGVSITYAEIVE